MLYRFYLRFCASINFFFERKLGYDDPGIFALLFITVIQMVYLFGFLYSIQIFQRHKFAIPASLYYVMFVIFIATNYFLAFRKEQLYECYTKRLKPVATISIILGGYLFMGVTGTVLRSYVQ